MRGLPHPASMRTITSRVRRLARHAMPDVVAALPWKPAMASRGVRRGVESVDVLRDTTDHQPRSPQAGDGEVARFGGASRTRHRHATPTLGVVLLGLRGSAGW